MENKVLETKIKRVETTVGELVETMTTIAAEHTTDEQEQYMLASQAIEEILSMRS